MPPKKKGKGKKNKNQENKTDTLTEVDKTFYELQITDLNRKIARLRQSSHEIEEKNHELEQRLLTLDDDRADVISYLKRSLNAKQNESLELQERVTALQEAKDSESTEYETKIEDIQTEFNVMREQLTSEIKLINGKLNALEEFRMLRDDLMEKFNQQEKTIQDQAVKEKKAMYEIEKKFIISKKTITNEMEKQLFKLANDFEKANEVRIAATTQRCIRENIALNNEVNRMIPSIQSLNYDIEDWKAKNQELKLNCELYQAERNKTLMELKILRGLLDQMTKEYNGKLKILRQYEIEIKKSRNVYQEIKQALARETDLNAKIKILEQNLHSTRCKETDFKQVIFQKNKQLNGYFEVVQEAIQSIESCLKISQVNDAEKQYRRDTLLQNLLTILTQPRSDSHVVSSLDTITSINAKYQKGDLGFLPKVKHTQPKIITQLLNAEVQVGRSVENMEKTPSHFDLVSMRTMDTFNQSEYISSSSSESLVFSEPDEIKSILSDDRSLFGSIMFSSTVISDKVLERLLSTVELAPTESVSNLVDDFIKTEVIGKARIERTKSTFEALQEINEETVEPTNDTVPDDQEFVNIFGGSDDDEDRSSNGDD